MINTIELLNAIQKIDTLKSGRLLSVKVDLDLPFFLKNISSSTQFRIVNNHDGEFSIVNEAYRVAIPYDFHNDGLFLKNNAPSLGILYCKNQGKQINDTAFIDGNNLLNLINENKQLLKKLQAVFVDRDGSEVENDLLQMHKWTKEQFLTLGSRVYIRPVKNLGIKECPTLRDISNLFTKIYNQIKISDKIIHKWHDNDLIIFDNQRYLHARAGTEADSGRELIRIWIDKI